MYDNVEERYSDDAIDILSNLKTWKESLSQK